MINQILQISLKNQKLSHQKIKIIFQVDDFFCSSNQAIVQDLLYLSYTSYLFRIRLHMMFLNKNCSRKTIKIQILANYSQGKALITFNLIFLTENSSNPQHLILHNLQKKIADEFHCCTVKQNLNWTYFDFPYLQKQSSPTKILKLKRIIRNIPLMPIYMAQDFIFIIYNSNLYLVRTRNMSFVQRRNRKTKYSDSMRQEKTFSFYAVNLVNEGASKAPSSSNFMKNQQASPKELISIFPLMKMPEIGHLQSSFIICAQNEEKRSDQYLDFIGTEAQISFNSGFQMINSKNQMLESLENASKSEQFQ